MKPSEVPLGGGEFYRTIRYVHPVTRDIAERTVRLAWDDIDPIGQDTWFEVRFSGQG